ncbi:MAG TPA: hypothetical protein VJN96_14250 [Vicinamibacterales bacterium]|nr:hypothetical protein [Vicinamibacterales bacterium]
MRIAFDLDGVLADLHQPFVQAAIRLFPELDASSIGSADVGASPPDEEVAREPEPQQTTRVALSNRQADAVWKYLGAIENFWEGLAEIESGAIAKLAKLADDRGWEVIFITSRPRSAGRTVQRQSQRWIQHLGFPMPSLFVVHGSRGRVAEALRLDVVVDDRPENCLDVVLESKAGAILVWRGSEDSVPASARRMGIGVVSTVDEALSALVEAERGAAEGGGLIDRLRRLLGLSVKPSRSRNR